MPSWDRQRADGGGLSALSGPFYTTVFDALNSVLTDPGPKVTQLLSPLLEPAEHLRLLNDPESVKLPDTEHTLPKCEFFSFAIV